MISLRRARELWHRFDVTAWFWPLGPVLLVAALLPGLRGHGTVVGTVPDRPFDALAVVAVVCETLPLALCRRWPTVCLTVVSVGFAADQLRGYHSLGGTGLALALVGAGSRLESHRRPKLLAFTAAYVLFCVALHRLGRGESPAEFVLFYLAMALVWAIGNWLRATQAAEEERRRRVAEDTLIAERQRIARELHDVVTHHVTAMVVQAEAARYLNAAPERLDQSLTAVTDTGRRAITDLRHLLDLLNPDHGTHSAAEPRTPPVGRLLTLVEDTRRAGQPVEFTEEGTPAESTGSADLVAYRVVQEALTNALKYAHGGRTSVEIRHSEKEITVKVSTDHSGSAAASPGGSGRGLTGLRERVNVLGGDFEAGRTAGGGFVVRARIPAGASS
ncbi:sensor histidine kinase [Streptomyces sp. NPDC015032]|uniref:sensor histidine kinase n=1 Tax=Streptomyces sp. NPDC015032 TaxID=3364937 RepID=UPI0036FF0F43